MKQVNKNKSLAALAFGAVASMATGCTALIDDAEKEIESNSSSVDEKLSQGKQLTRSSTAVSVQSGMYISGKTFRLTDKDQLPDMFNAAAGFNQVDPISFQEIIGIVSNGINVRVDLSQDAIEYLKELGSNGDEVSNDSETAENGQTNINEIADFAGKSLVGSDVKFTFEYEGTVKSVLDKVTSMANLSWKWESGKVTIFRHETKHYQFDGSLISTAFKSSVSSAEKNGGSSSSQSVDMEAKSFDVYEDLEKTLESMITKGQGRFSSNRQTGMITVTDTPRVQAAVQNYIEEMNGIFNTQIAIRAEVYEVVSDDYGNFGIDWAMAYDGSKNMSLGFESAMNTGSTPQMNLGIISPSSNFSGSKAFVNALNKVNDVTLVTSASVYTTNGESVPIQIADEVNYVEKFTRDVDDQGTVSFSVEPNSFLTGFTMNVTPRMTSDGKVSMQFAVNMSELNELKDISYGEGENEVKIQLPNRTSKNFMQKVGVSSGETVMISGFERTKNEAKTSSLGDKMAWLAGGSRAGGKKKVVTMIMLTPYVMAK